MDNIIRKLKVNISYSLLIVPNEVVWEYDIGV